MLYYQESLFPTNSALLKEADRTYIPISQEMLSNWQKRIREFQQKERSHEPQPDPWLLPTYPLEFFRLPDQRTDPCLYFLLDTTSQLILYIGETLRADQRWLGKHDCKRYIANYLAVHHAHQLNPSIQFVFWWLTDRDRHDRQQLEATLIDFWKSPFNKENWQLWQTPFTL